MLFGLAFCIFSTFSLTFSDETTPGVKVKKTSGLAEKGTTAIKLSHSDLNKTTKSYTVPPSYRTECENIQPCVKHITKISQRFADLNKRFNGEKLNFPIQDYQNYNFLNDDEATPCDVYRYDSETLIALVNICSGISGRAPKNVPTKGEVWPQPYYQKKDEIINEISVEELAIKAIGSKCSFLDKAVDRSVDYIHTLANLSKKYSTAKSPRQRKILLSTVEVNMTEPVTCEGLYPQLGMDERYNLTVSRGKASIVSATVWGALRGIETFTHLLWLPENFEYIAINNTIIEDRPNYPHRGLLVDTARYFINVSHLLRTLDAMAMNKMNVLHWHMVDDESFPLQSDKFPELSEKAAFHPSMVYNKTHLETIRDFARDRGIRVMVEIDMPGHASSWGVSHPEIMTQKCQASTKYSRPLNPLKEKTYEVLRNVIEEIQSIFPEKYLHVGGDEVYTDCWSKDPATRKYMDEQNKHENDLLNLFHQKVVALIKNDTVPVVWEEVFTSNVSLSKNTVIQTWVGGGSKIMSSILNEGYSAIQSNYYYLDHLTMTFNSFYAMEPRISVKGLVKNNTLLNNLLGGEACVWGEMMDLSNFLSRVWPRTSAIAEVLWSETKGQNPGDFTLSRIEEHACRMRRRGVAADTASGPSFCIN